MHPLMINFRSLFLNQAPWHLESFVLCTETTFLCTDFVDHDHVDVQDNPDAESCLDLMDSFGRAQHVHFSGTYTAPSYNPKMDSISQDALISGSVLSDHVTGLFNLKGFKSESRKEIGFWKIKSSYLPKLKSNLCNSELLL